MQGIGLLRFEPLRFFLKLFPWAILFVATLWADKLNAAPNIVFIMVDDLGFGELQWYPEQADISTLSATTSDAIQTPSLFALAKGGVRFTNYHSAAPVCSPSRAAILTSRYPAEFGLRDVYSSPSGRGLPAGVPTIASLLSELAGYSTAHIGKWHLGGAFAEKLPVYYGFDQSLVRDGHEVVDGYLDTVFIEDADIAGMHVLEPGKHSAETMTNKAIEYINTASATGSPYFLNLWFRAPHSPLDPPGNFPQATPESSYTPNTLSQWPEDWATIAAVTPQLAELASLQNHSPTADAKKRAMYIATIAWLDYQIGRLVEAINTHDPSGNTLIVFVSDNGANKKPWANGTGSTPGTWLPNGQLQGSKGNVFQGGINVPMLVYWPAGGLPAGAVNNEFVIGYDFLPTLLDAANLSVSSSNFVGVSFLDNLFGQGAFPVRTNPLIWEQKNFNGGWGRTDTFSMLDDEQNRYAVRDPILNRKLVYEQNSLTKLVEPYLFDLAGFGIAQNGEVQSLIPQLDDGGEAILQQGIMNADYRAWRQQVGTIPNVFDFSATTAVTEDLCIEFSESDHVAKLEDNELYSFREGDFSFQTRVELDELPGSMGATIAEHPGSWQLSLETDGSDSVLAQLEVVAKNAEPVDLPGLPGDTVTLSNSFACSVPCSFNIGFTLLGIVYGEPSIRLYLEGNSVDEFSGNSRVSPYIREVYASTSDTVRFGNGANGQSALQGRLVDPRIWSLNLTPAELVQSMYQQNQVACDFGGCH